MFDRCCSNRSTIEYEIVHNPQPISLSNDMDAIIKNLLWYAPNIDSFQAEKNDLISDKIYDDFSFTYIINHMGMDEVHDVKWIEPNAPFDDNDWTYYESHICNNCQKLIITRQRNLSKTNDLLRCLRNCIAHGHFAIVDDFLIGFNKQVTRNNPEGIKKAVIKIKPQLLLNALKSLISPMGKEHLLAYAFKKVGYTIIQQPMADFRFDLLIEKDGKQYTIEIKDYRGHFYLHRVHLQRFLMETEHLLPGTERVLFIDTSRVTKDVRRLEKEIEKFRIVDINQVKQLLQENPVDIFAQTE